MMLTPETLLLRLTRLQHPDGLLPSTRTNPAWFYERADTNLFFTAIIIFTLQGLRAKLSGPSRNLVDTLSGKAVVAYELFRNKNGLATYNFYRTRPSKHFPNGLLFRHFRHFQLPDDVDDTAMVYLTTNPSRMDLDWLKTKLTHHANGVRGVAPHTFADYRHLAAYSTWFGKNMPVELDACALTNLLYCIYRYGLPRNHHDADSLTFLRSIVETDRYRTDPFRCAHNYARTSLIFYHLARFIGAFDPPELRAIRPKLILDARAALTGATNRMEQVLLATSLLRLGEAVDRLNLEGIETDFAHFHFFIAGLLSAYPQPWLYRWAHRPFWHIRWRCDAYNWALVLEYVVLADESTRD